MALTDFPLGHALAVKHYQRDLLKEALKRTSVLQFMGRGDDSLLQIQDSLTKEAGDNITMGLRMQLSGGGVAGDGTLEGNEEALSIYTDSIYIDQLRHAVRSKGKASEQRVPFKVREEARDGLADWWANRIDTSFFSQIAGDNHTYGDTKYTGMQAVTDPITASDTDHYYMPEGQTTEAGVASKSASAIFKLSLIDRLRTKAETQSPQLRPFKLRGEDYYVIFLHPLQIEDMRTNTDTGQWQDIQLAAMKGGQITGNAIFTGATGVYNKTVIHSNTRVPAGNTTPTAGAIKRAIFCGAQSACVAWGMGGGPSKDTWVEGLFDYESQLGVAAGTIWGLKKARFNSKDFGTIVVPTYTTNAS